NQHEVLETLDGVQGRMKALLLRRLELARSRLGSLAGRRVFREPLERVRERQQHLDATRQRLDRAVQQRLGAAETRVQARAGKLQALSPLNVLARGYSLTRTIPDGQVVRNASQVEPGDLVLTELHAGRVVSRVEAVANPEGMPARERMSRDE